MMTNETLTPTPEPRPNSRLWVYDLLMVLVLLAGAYFRTVGINWGDNQYLHPDERFLIWVTADIAPVQSLSEYFDTAHSTLNPNNRGHGFYVYGTLPIFLARYLVDGIYPTVGWSEITAVGRSLSALADLLTVLLVYLVASRLYDRRVGLLAGAFYAFAVLPIQLSHFFKEDTFLNFFSFLAIYFAIRVGGEKWKVRSVKWEVESGMGEGGRDDRQEASEERHGWAEFLKQPYFLLSLAFGVSLGCAVASKLNAAPVALMLPGAFVLSLVKLPAEERERRAAQALAYLVLAAVVSVLVFRILQPYAFSGPGFFGLKPNPQWVANIEEQRQQSTGDVDFPPALQWARRPVWFSGENLTVWGLGLPLGILAWIGFLWAGWRMLKGDWQRHALLWGWTAFYFIWQSSQFNPTMRYELPIYPTLAIFAGWAVVALWDAKPVRLAGLDLQRIKLPRIAAFVMGGAVLVLTFAWAFAFTRIYTRPVTRVAATRWIYQNVPGPINLPIQTADGQYNQPLPFPLGVTITPDQPFQTAFSAQASGVLQEIYLAHVTDQQLPPSLTNLTLVVSAFSNGQQPLAKAVFSYESLYEAGLKGKDYTLTLDQPVPLAEEQNYFLLVQISEGNGLAQLCGLWTLNIQTSSDTVKQPLPQPELCDVRPDQPLSILFTTQAGGTLDAITFQHVAQQEVPGSQTLGVALSQSGVDTPQATATLTANFTPQSDPRGQGYRLTLSQPFPVVAGQQYNLTFTLQSGSGSLAFAGSAPANESTWDDAIPLRMDGYDGYGGIYRGDLNFEMYWDDNPDKLTRFKSILDQADYIFITSNRQWGTTTRVPERYPLTTTYYRNLIGCPPEKSVLWCYDVAQVGTFQGNLGFELVKVFDSSPNIGPLRINDQFAEEAFTVYDHPKVFIFRKTQDYSAQKVSAILDAVDLSQVVHVTPRQAGSNPANLMLPSDRLAEQQAGGTWSQLFNPAALQNSNQFVGTVLWYLSVALLGLLAYPLVRLAFPGLSDHGYPIARTAGMLLLSYLVWLAGSFNIPFSRLTISLAVALMALVGGYLAYRQRDELREEIRQRGRYFLLVEGLFLAFFLFDLFIRLGNPDLWHPFKGGEKPMDFAFFNAVLKSTTFPPYDPWYAGGYLNYYYYGFMLVGVLVKWLGIVPAIAYNLILPTIFAMVALGAFSLAWNLYNAASHRLRNPGFDTRNVLVGLAGALGMMVLGNLGTVRMIFQGYEKLAAPGGVIVNAGILTRWVWAARGFVLALAGHPLPYSLGDWYWIPSRAIPVPPGDIEPITEFPFFTALYGDPHAHLFALPITLLALVFALSVVLSRGRWKGLLGGGVGFFMGGLAIGVLRPTNTWDFPTYLALGVAAVGYAFLTRPKDESSGGKGLTAFLDGLPDLSHRLVMAAGGVILLIVLSLVLFQPYVHWYELGYSKVDLWTGARTPLSAYFTHWGLFLFVIVSWMIWETREWLASTPVSSLRKLEPYKGSIELGIALLLAVVIGLLWFKVVIAWVVLPLAVWAGVLLLRPDQPDSKRFVLFLVGTGLILTLMVEVIVLRGDIARMNTVFKFYLQVWTLFAISAAAALGWLLPAFAKWHPHWRMGWQSIFALLVGSAALFTLLGGMAKIQDRMAPAAPHTLDGMAYMQYAYYPEGNQTMDLSQDYQAIRWMQENVKGSPVIVEAAGAGIQYAWYARFSIYTGLPDVVGWQWHEQQQRVLVPGDPVAQRGIEVGLFYQTTDLNAARDFLRKYNVRYIIVGQLERDHYAGPGLDKFPAANGVLWQEVYRDRDTVIYKVMNP